MRKDRLLLDTFFIQALLNRNDQYHEKAKDFFPRVQAAAEVWITEAILIEIGDACSDKNRSAACQFIERCYHSAAANLRLVKVDSLLIRRALDIYCKRPDKSWGFTDCISFIVMDDQDLMDAVTGDKHFEQAGFRALLLE